MRLLIIRRKVIRHRMDNYLAFEECLLKNVKIAEKNALFGPKKSLDKG